MRSITLAAASHRNNSEDRLVVVSLDRHWLVAIADGTGGLAGGGHAANLFVHGVHRACHRPGFAPSSPDAWLSLLAELDNEIMHAVGAGETTGIALVMTATAIIGASCGDSEAWLFEAPLGTS